MSVKRQLLFVQGGGKGVHDEWDSKLVASLRQELGQDYEIHYPRMPSEDNPSYTRWKTALVKALATLPDGAILVGHSVSLGGRHDSSQSPGGASSGSKGRRGVLDCDTFRREWRVVR